MHAYPFTTPLLTCRIAPGLTHAQITTADGKAALAEYAKTYTYEELKKRPATVPAGKVCMRVCARIAPPDLT